MRDEDATGSYFTAVVVRCELKGGRLTDELNVKLSCCLFILNPVQRTASSFSSTGRASTSIMSGGSLGCIKKREANVQYDAQVARNQVGVKSRVQLSNLFSSVQSRHLTIQHK